MAGPNRNFDLGQLIGNNGPAVGALGVPVRPSVNIKAPSAPAATNNLSVGDINSWVSGNSKNFSGQALNQPYQNKVSVFIDPSSRNITISAPQWYLDTKEFQEQVFPEFKKLEGKPISDIQFKSLIDAGMVSDLQKQVDALKPRNDAIVEYKKQFPKATTDDAMLYLRNAAASERSDNDKDTLVVTGLNDDGSFKTQSVKDAIANIKTYSDKQRGQMLTNSDKEIADATSEQERAIKLGLKDFFVKKKVFDAGTLTQLNRAAESGLEKIASSITGKVADVVANATPFGIAKYIATGSGIDTAKAVKESIDKDATASLKGADTIKDFTAPGIDLLTTAGDVALTAPVGGGAVKSLTTLGMKTAPTARLIETAGKGLDKLEDAGKVGQITADTIKGMPADLAYGVGKTLTDKDYNGAQDFALNTALNAGTLGAAKAIGATVRAVDTSTNKSLTRATARTGQGIYKGVKAITNIPVVGDAMKRFSTKIIDEAAPVRRAFREAIADAGSGKELATARSKYMEINNALRQSSQRGAPEAKMFRTNTPEYSEAFEINANIQKQGKEQFKKTNEYVDAQTVLERAEAGQYGKLSEEQMGQLQTRAAELRTPEAEEYRLALARTEGKITDLGTQYDILDEDIINYMRDPKNKEFADNYIHLQRDIDLKENPYQKGGSKSLKGAQPVRKLKGLSDAELIDPFITMNERLQVLTKMIAENPVNVMVKDAVSNGTIGGRVIADAGQIKRRSDLKFEASEEKRIVTDALKDDLDDLSGQLNRLVDDVEDFSGAGREAISSQIDDMVDQLVDSVLDDPKLQQQLVELMDTLGNGREGAETVAALGIIQRQKKSILDFVGSKLLNSPLGKDERNSVVAEFSDAIKTKFEGSVKGQGLGINSGKKALSARAREIKELNADIGTVKDTRGSNVIAYYENGQKGYVELDDPDLADYFNSRKTIVQDGAFAHLAANVSRVFRFGTTGGNPIFALFVNPARDIPQAAVAAGTEVLAPVNVVKAIMDAQNITGDQARVLADGIQKQFELRFGQSNQINIQRGDVGVDKDKVIQIGDAQARQDRRNYRDIRDEQRDQSVGGKVVNLINPRRALVNVEDYLGEIEFLTRQRVYKARLQAALTRGENIDNATNEAIFYASEATTNFLNIGSSTRQLLRTVPYLSSAINGKASFMRLWALDPIGVSMRMMAGVVMPATLLATNNLSTDEKKAVYQNISEYEKRNNFIIVTDGEAKNVIKIPMSFELSAIYNPYREYVETMSDFDPKSFQEIMVKGLLGASPIDMSALATKNYKGEVDLGQAAAQIGSGLLPQVVRPAFEIYSGKNLYTGQRLNPTDQELIDRNQIEVDADVKPSDRTYSSRDSQTLGRISDFLGMDQGSLQSVISSYGGSVAQYLLNGIDKLSGAPANKQGGKGIEEDLRKRFLGVTDQSTGDYYTGIDELEDEKKRVIERLDRIDRNNYTAEGDQDALDQNAETRQKIIDDFGQKVATFANQYGEFYQRSGGFKPFQADALVRLLNFGPSAGTFEAGSYQAGDLQTVRNEARNDAQRRASVLGLPGTGSRDIFGRTTANDAGDPVTSYYSTTMQNGLIRDRVYGAPKQMAYEFNQIFKADRNAGIPSMYDVKKSYDKELSDLYEQAKGLKGQAATDLYSRISDLQEKYMTEEFDTRIRPLIEKYGVEAVRNSKVAKEIESYVVVPNDFTPFASRKKQPYLKDDTWAYIKDRYGVGDLNGQNFPTDEAVVSKLEQVNADISAGRRASAGYKLNTLEQQINSGKVFVDADTMDQISGMIKSLNSNKRKRR